MVWQSFKQLALGLLLITFSAGVLLLSDWNRRISPNEGLSKETLLSTQTARLNLLYYIDAPAFEEARDGMLAGLKEAGLVKDKDFTIVVRNSQGDMATANSMIDLAVTEETDLIMTLSTPMLQAAINRAGNIPIVFSLVADPILAGAGKSNEHHRPNVTGVYTTSDFDGMMTVLPQFLPHARRVGTLFAPAEINSVFYKDALTEAARKVGIEVIGVGIGSTADVADGVLALISKDLDAICQISDNLTSASFVSILRAAKKARLPLFGFQSSQARDGAIAVIARDFEDAGREAAFLAARILRGESPRSIPFQPIKKSRLIINLDAAQAVNLNVPLTLMEKADSVIGHHSWKSSNNAFPKALN